MVPRVLCGCFSNHLNCLRSLAHAGLDQSGFGTRLLAQADAMFQTYQQLVDEELYNLE